MRFILGNNQKSILIIFMLFINVRFLLSNDFIYEKSIPYEDFNNLNIIGKVYVFFTQSSDNTILLKAKNELDLDAIEYGYNKKTLTLQHKRDRKETRRFFGVSREIITSYRAISDLNVYINKDNIEFINISGSGSFYTDVISQRNLKINISGEGSTTLCGEVDRLYITISGSGRVLITNLRAQEVDLTVAGTGGINIDNIDLHSITMQISGSGNTTVIGVVNKLAISVSGSGKVNTFNLIAKEVDVSVSGSGRVNLFAKEILNAHASGSGRIIYLGNPQINHKVTIGSGKIDRN